MLVSLGRGVARALGARTLAVGDAAAATNLAAVAGAADAGAPDQQQQPSQSWRQSRAYSSSADVESEVRRGADTGRGHECHGALRFCTHRARARAQVQAINDAFAEAREDIADARRAAPPLRGAPPHSAPQGRVPRPANGGPD
jgi:hypothetical protein